MGQLHITTKLSGYFQVDTWSVDILQAKTQTRMKSTNGRFRQHTCFIFYFHVMHFPYVVFYNIWIYFSRSNASSWWKLDYNYVVFSIFKEHENSISLFILGLEGHYHGNSSPQTPCRQFRLFYRVIYRFCPKPLHSYCQITSGSIQNAVK